MKRREDGFTIVELVVTIAIVGVVVAALTALFVGISRSQSQSNYKENATRAAMRQVESLRNNNYLSLTPGANINFTNELSPKLPSGSTGNVQVSEPVSGLRRVDVTVTYPDGEKTHKVVLSSLIGEIGITQ